MAQKDIHVFWKISSHGLKAFIFSCSTTLLLCGMFIWFVSRAPLDISFAKTYIETALHDQATGNHAKIDKAILFWPDLRGPLYLQLQGGQLLNAQNTSILSTKQVDISFSRIGLLRGRIMPKSIIIKEPTLRLERSEAGSFELGLGQKPSTTEKQEQLALTTRIFGYIARPGYESAHDSLIARLSAFAIQDAHLLIEDKIAKQTWSLPGFNVELLSTQDGMKGHANLTLPQTGLEKPVLDVNMSYLWDQKNVELSADIHSIDLGDIIGKIPDIQMPGTQNMVVNARIDTILDETFMPADIRLHIESEHGDVLYPDFSDAPIAYKDMNINATYNYAGKTLTLSDAALTLDEDIKLSATAHIAYTQTSADGEVTLQINKVAQTKIATLWPKFLKGENIESWLVEKMSGGTFKDIAVTTDLFAEKTDAPDKTSQWMFNIRNLIADFAVDDMTLEYRPPLDKAENLHGSGRFDAEKDRLDITIDKGRIGQMDVSGSTLFFDDIIAEGKGDAHLDIDLKGDIADIVRYITKDPINLGQKIPMDPDKIRGTADLNLDIVFPAQKHISVEDFHVNVSGTLDKVLFPAILKKMDISEGPLNLSVRDGKVALEGKALLDKRAMDFAWETFLESKDKPYVEKIKAKITADPNLRAHLGIDLGDFLEGPLPIDLTYTSFHDDTAKADITVDMTPSLFFVSPFGYEKQPGEKASAQLSAYLKNGTIRHIQNLSAQGNHFTLSSADIYFTQDESGALLKSGTLPSFTLEETQGALSFSFDQDRKAHINIEASFLDARPFMETAEGSDIYTAPPMRITTTATHMRTAPGETAHNVKILMDIDEQGRFNEMEMDARIGESDMFVRFNEEQDGKRTFRMKSDDAGALLKAFQIHNDIRGGTILIYATPMRGVLDRNLRGKAEISNFTLVKAPALTKVLSLLSLTGIGDALSNKGLKFSKLEADFSWLYRGRGSLLEIRNGRTSGNALGLLFEGSFDHAANFVNVSGTVVPMDGLNKIITKIPIVGDILTGGSGGVFAATYTIKGPADDPVISVNPLSVLTPGILRRILWE